jgi:hypothetical protein
MGIMGVPPERPRTRSPSRARSRVGAYPEHHRLVPDALSEISETFVDEEFRPLDRNTDICFIHPCDVMTRAASLCSLIIIIIIIIIKSISL